MIPPPLTRRHQAAGQRSSRLDPRKEGSLWDANAAVETANRKGIAVRQFIRLGLADVEVILDLVDGEIIVAELLHFVYDGILLK